MREYKLFAQRIGLVGLANLLTSFSGILLVPILTKTLSIEEYGIWAQIMVTIGLIPSIVMLGLPYTMVRFLAGAKKREEIQEGFYSIASIILVTSAVTSFLLFFSSKWIAALLFNDNILITKILSLIILVECLNSLVLNFFRTFQQIKKYSLFMSIQTFLNMLLVAYFVLADYGIIGAAVGVLMAKSLILIITTSIIIFKIGFKIPEFRNIKRYLAFGLPTVPGNLSSWVVTSSDRYIIGILLGTAYVGYYSPGYALGSTIQLFIGPLGLLLPAALSKHYDENDMEAVKTVLKYSLKYFLLFAIPSAFGLSMLSKPMLVILSTPEIALQGYLVTPFLAISSVFFGALVVISHIIILEKKTTITGSIYILAAILNFVLNLILVPHMGITGAAFTTMIAYLVLFILGTHYSFKYIKFDIGLQFIMKSIFASIVMSLVIFMWNPEGLPNVLAVVGVCAIVYAAVLLLFKGISREEIAFFRRLFRA
jgi:O-antigen/teichoic acid export membrane protein